ncbi:hypothetical protein P691DRAFT_19879 [Macrolepiota fuliginosa MF-IS2]|uniref:Uncharacterized protein n=1 Tax=Macrolepiota fuliginosa MF-IS2 TaxID=1400762 RepID=A0A9P5XME7_9AGAR|nr:hypothetical protein P691DRAFT_19879 [Macrolepiota fuliginosa MF-IS2]
MEWTTMRNHLEMDLFVLTAEHEGDEILREITLQHSITRRNGDLDRLSAQANPSLTQHDILRPFASTQRFNPSQTRLRKIASRLDNLTDSLLQYFPVEDDGKVDTAKNNPTVQENILLEKVQSLLEKVQFKYDDNLSLLTRLSELLDQLSAIHELLHQTLKQTTESLSIQHNGLIVAHGDHISATIEASLVKISLLRARAQRSLYGAKSQTQPGSDTTIASAIGIAYRKLKADEDRMREEERALDKKLKEYEELMAVVDGGLGGFRQVMNDWTRVRKETEECRKDLRRLGWTGD